jgi:hypothetical protein
MHAMLGAPLFRAARRRGAALRGLSDITKSPPPRPPTAAAPTSPQRLQPPPFNVTGVSLRQTAGGDALARREAVRSDNLPAKYVPHTLTQIQKGSYFTLFALSGGLVLVMYLLGREDDETTAKDKMALLAQALRRQRAGAKEALLACATDAGEVDLGRGRAIRWWATGPADADTFVLLHAEDGETAAVWGYVHAALAERLATCGGGEDALPQSVRVVSFHRVGVTPSPQRSTPLSLRVRDADAVMQQVCLAGRAAARQRAGGGWARLWAGDGSRHQPPRAVLVAQGEGAWGGLAWTGLHSGGSGSGDRADASRLAQQQQLRLPYVAAGAVLVAPIQFYRGAYQAWWDAVVSASRTSSSSAAVAAGTHAAAAATGGGTAGGHADATTSDAASGAKGVIERLLAPPPVKDDLAAVTDPSKRAADQLRAVLPDAAAAPTFRVNAFINPDAAKAKAMRREAEALRRRRAQLPVLSSQEAALVDEVAPAAVAPAPPRAAGAAAAGAAPALPQQQPAVTAITFAPSALPPFVHRLRRTAAAAWWLQAANSVGAAMLPEPERAALRRQRADVMAAVNAAGAGAAVKQPASGAGSPQAGSSVGGGEALQQAAAAAAPTAAAVAVTADTTVGDLPVSAAHAGGGSDTAAATTHAATRENPLDGYVQAAQAATAATRDALVGAYGRAVDFAPAKREEELVRRGLAAVPMALGLVPPPSPASDPWYRHLAVTEAAALPAAERFKVVSLEGPPDRPLPPSAPEAAALAAAGADYEAALVCLPLQCPGAIAAEVMALVAGGGRGAAAAPPAAASLR